MKRFGLVIIINCLLNITLKSQGIENIIVSMASNIASGYVKPLASTFGSNLNTDWVTKVPSAAYNDFTIQIRLIATGSFFKGENRNFNTIGSYRLNFNDVERLLKNSGIKVDEADYYKIQSYLLAYPITVYANGPTIIGSDKKYLNLKFPETTIEGRVIKEMEFDAKEAKGLLGTFDLLPNVTMQINIGTFCGTNVSARYLPGMNIPDVGRFTYWGLGFINSHKLSSLKELSLCRIEIISLRFSVCRVLLNLHEVRHKLVHDLPVYRRNNPGMPTYRSNRDH